ncbi:MFS transporter [Nonomuraea rhizosphaerae]|uniref:MFS transporter n=1 Tax=Nonomuraea rhizosphaerae TaxID=2665663 RepID=UPI001C5F3844|nr:MFS transporter [Nonomuraea rhizosphaerae]
MLWTGETLSSLGTWIQWISLPLWILTVTGSPLAAGAALALETLPRILLAPWAGLLIDRLDRRTVALGSNLTLSALTTATIPAVLTESVIIVYALTLLTSALQTVSTAAPQAMIPRLVPESRLTTANTAMAWTTGATMALGPLAGVGIATAIGFPSAITANAISYGAAVLCLLGVGRQTPTSDGPAPTRTLRDGLAALLQDPVLRYAVLSEGAVLLFFGAAPQFIVISVNLTGTPTGSGLFVSGMGAGWLMTSLTLSKIRLPVDPLALLITGAISTAPIALTAAAAAHLGTAWTFTAGLLMGALNLSLLMAPNLLSQQRADNAVLGRLYSFRRSLALTAQLASIGLWSVTTEILREPAWAIAGGGILATLTALPLTLRARNAALQATR